MFEGGKVMGLIITEPYWPIALKTDDGQLVFSGIEGEKSDPIPIPQGVSEVGLQMLWLSEGAQYLVPVLSGGWMDLDGDKIDPEPKKGVRRVLSIYYPHTPSYAGGATESWKICVSTVLREKDLPLRRDAQGTWTARGEFLERSDEISPWDWFEVVNEERSGGERFIRMERVENLRD